MLQVAELEGQDYSSPMEVRQFYHALQIPDMELQNLMIVLIDFSFALLRLFLAKPLFVHLRMEIFTLCHYMLKAFNLFFI